MNMYIGAPSRIMHHVQTLVKRFNGRFIGYKWQHNKEVQHFSLYFEDVNMSNQFNRMMEIVKQPYF
jgi:hypothetical protein